MKTKTKVSTQDCGLCHSAHQHYTVKLNGRKEPYVICEAYQKPVLVNLYRDKPHATYQPNRWTIDEGSEHWSPV